MGKYKKYGQAKIGPLECGFSSDDLLPASIKFEVPFCKEICASQGYATRTLHVTAWFFRFSQDGTL